jgi:tripartite-type tricarboxylate transporter receptor subunit TctC
MFKSLAIALAIAAGTAGCLAETFPSRPITIVVPSAAGGVGDIMARLIGDKVSQELHVPVIIDSRPGASGAIGSTSVMRAPADGYTVLLANGASHGALPALNKQLPYDPIRDFIPVARVGETQLALIASPKLPVKTAQDLIAYARKIPES